MIFVLLPANRIINGISQRTPAQITGKLLVYRYRKRVNSFKVTHPQARIIHLGIGDVTLPIPKACVEAMQKAAGELGNPETFRGYGPEQGYDF